MIRLHLNMFVSYDTDNTLQIQPAGRSALLSLLIVPFQKLLQRNIKKVYVLNLSQSLQSVTKVSLFYFFSTFIYKECILNVF